MLYKLDYMYFDKHVFFCINVRNENETCCGHCDAQGLQRYAKDRIREFSKLSEGKIRINKAGCLGRCDFGPVLVIYPEAVWYQYLDKNDIDEIITSHLIDGKIVERLVL